MKTILTLFLLLPFLLFSQEKEDTSIVVYPDKEAEFPGGPEAMKQFLANNLVYPEEALINGDQGKVFIEFIVNTDGSVSDITMLRGVSREIDKESMRVIALMPAWISAELDSEKVRAKCRVPINFYLQNSNRKSRKKERRNK